MNHGRSVSTINNASLINVYEIYVIYNEAEESRKEEDGDGLENRISLISRTGAYWGNVEALMLCGEQIHPGASDNREMKRVIHKKDFLYSRPERKMFAPHFPSLEFYESK